MIFGALFVWLVSWQTLHGRTIWFGKPGLLSTGKKHTLRIHWDIAEISNEENG